MHPAPTTPKWTIHTATPASLPEISRFINASRRVLFPSLGRDALFDSAEVLRQGSVVFARAVAGDAAGEGEREGEIVGEIVGAVAYIPFDFRFPELPYPVGMAGSLDGDVDTSPSSASASACTSGAGTPSSLSSLSSASPAPSPKTVEIIRLFIAPAHRRQGLARALFTTLLADARARDVRVLYLHTHPFLEGAIRFWQGCGFEVVSVDEEDGVWRTHHMVRDVGDVDTRGP